jgi:hypothetical protein
MTTTKTQPAKKATTRKPATKAQPAKAKTTQRADAPKEQTKPAPKPKATKPEPKTLIEALTTGQTVLLKVRANGTKRSLPYYAEGSEYRTLAQTATTLKANGKTVDAIAEEMKVSTATARRFLTGLSLAHEVESGKFDKQWKPGTTEVVVHTVVAKQAKA